VHVLVFINYLWYFFDSITIENVGIVGVLCNCWMCTKHFCSHPWMV